MHRDCKNCKHIRIASSKPLNDADFSSKKGTVCNLCKSIQKRVGEKWRLAGTGKKSVRKTSPNPPEDPNDYFEDKQAFIDLLLRLWLETPEGDKCYYTGIPMKIKTSDGQRSWSIDRMDSNKPYSPRNIVLCVNSVNIMKRALGSDAFLALGVAITRHHIEHGTSQTISDTIEKLLNEPSYPNVRPRIKSEI